MVWDVATKKRDYSGLPPRGVRKKESVLSAHVAVLAKERPELFDASVSAEERKDLIKQGGYVAFRTLCRSHTALALETLVSACKATNSETGAADYSTRVKAANLLLEHGWGKAVQAVAVADAREEESKEIVTLSKEKLEAIARAVLPENNDGDIENGD